MRILVVAAIIMLFAISIAESSGSKVYVAEIDGVIGQGTVNLFEKAISEAEDDGEALIIMLNTNGGLTTATENIIQKIENAEIPVIIYVAPSGSVAFSAGTFILMSSHIAVMDNATVIGAAQPRIVNPITGLAEKADNKEINAFANLMQTLAEEHSRNSSIAVQFVTDNVALTEEEAYDAGIIEIIAADVQSLLDQLDGLAITVNGNQYLLQTANASIKEIDWGLRDTVINYVSDPQLASLLLTIGIFGLIFGFLTPGFHVPEVVGAILIVFSLYGLSLIGVNAAGVLLLSLAFIFFIIEIVTPTFGYWTIAAVITFIFGIILIPSEDAMYYMPQSWFTTFRIASVVVALVIAAFFIFAITRAMQAKKIKPRIGKSDLVGLDGIAVTRIMDKGQVKVQGEIWFAKSEYPIEQGEEIIVISQNGLKLAVEKKN